MFTSELQVYLQAHEYPSQNGQQCAGVRCLASVMGEVHEKPLARFLS